jgi:CRP-like cAMP-binding protein
MTGLAIVMEYQRASHDTYVQAATGPCCATLMHTFCRPPQTALANGRSKIEERLARWLMADDRIDGDRLPLTHEFLSLMLGVRRSGVTTPPQALERKGLISRTRANVLVLDRKGLEKQSNGTYLTFET